MHSTVRVAAAAVHLAAALWLGAAIVCVTAQAPVVELGVLTASTDGTNCVSGLQFSYAARAVATDIQQAGVWSRTGMVLDTANAPVDSAFEAVSESLEWFTGACKSPAGAAAAQCMKAGIVGPASSNQAESVSQLAAKFATAAVSYSATSTTLLGRPFFYRAVPTDDATAKAILKLVKMFGWHYISILKPRSDYGQSLSAELVVDASDMSEGHLGGDAYEIEVFADVPYVGGDAASIDTALELLEKQEARIVILIANNEQMREIMLAAHAKGMTGAGWTYIGTESVTEEGLLGGNLTPAQRAALQEAMFGMLGVVVDTSVEDPSKVHWDWALNEEPAPPPFTFTDAEVAACPRAATATAFLYLPYVYDATYMFAHAAARVRGCPEGGGTCAVPFSQMKAVNISAEMESDDANVPTSPVTGLPLVLDVVTHQRSSTRLMAVAVGDGFVWRVGTVDVSNEEEVGEWVGKGPGGAFVDIRFPSGDTSIPTDRHSVQVSLTAAFFFMALVGVLVATHVGIGMEARHFFYIPESGVTIIAGMLLGLFIDATGNKDLIETAEFNEGVFALVFLPIIIFESGYSLNKHPFLTQIGSILTFAVFGTVISTVIVGLGVWGLGAEGIITPVLSWQESMAFAALICAVDPVATLATFGALKVDPTLNAVVYGESVINDAVSLVLYRTFVTFLTAPADGASALAAVGTFFLISIVSLLIGLVVGVVATLSLKHAHFEGDGVLEAVVIMLFAYSSFTLAESMHLSGIVAVLTTGIVMNHYTRKNLSPQAKPMVQHALITVSKIADAIIFFLVGLNVTLFFTAFSAGFTFATVGLCLVGRAMNVFPLSLCLNRGRKEKLPLSFQYIAWHSGLRGAIAYAISVEFPSQHRAAIVDATSIIILLSVFLLGGSTIVAIKGLGVPYNVEETHEEATKKAHASAATGFKRTVRNLDNKIYAILVKPDVALKHAAGNRFGDDDGVVGAESKGEDAEGSGSSITNPLRRAQGGRSSA